MASEAAQNFLQPLSSWMSQIYEAIQQAGDSISASLLNLSGAGRKSGEEKNQDLENNGIYEDYSEESDDERHLDLWDEEYLYPREDGHIGGPDLASQDLPDGSDMRLQRQKRVKNTSRLPEQCVESTRSLTTDGSYWTNEDLQPPLDRLPPIAEEEGEPSMRMGGHELNLSLGGSLKCNNGKASFAVNSYREDEEQTASSGSNDEVIKQFEISVSRSQSFRSEVFEKATPAGVEHRRKFRRLPSSHKEHSTEVSECK
ncbi:PREDICTED: synaptotagmin-16-like, partial [Leptosomus discolor]|uniref:synaptotagmin-16-like n=1 Tax=Leptosomus discolor TaxID=188344 RepID=UPI0005226CED